MKKNEVKIGETYMAKVTNSEVPVRTICRDLQRKRSRGPVSAPVLASRNALTCREMRDVSAIEKDAYVDA